MKNLLVTQNRGFTLIELLVVVFIIGILSAIALPQYRVAVIKARYMQLVTAVESLRQAEESFFLANGAYTLEAENLDISLPGDTSGQRIVARNLSCSLASEDNVILSYIFCTNEDSLGYYYNPHSKQRKCFSYEPSSSVLSQVCKSFGGGSGVPSCNGTCLVYTLP